MKKVIIIGGGFAGAHAAKILENRFDVTLIDNKDYFEFTPGILRTIVEPNHLKSLQELHSNYLKKTNIIIAAVQKITNKEVVVQKKKYTYDYLIISSGSDYTTPIKEQGVVFATRGNHLMDAYKKVQNAEQIVIVGGGLVGIELAAELATHCSKKNITLIHSKDVLIERNNPKSQKYAETFLRKRNVNILFNERLISSDKGIYKTERGSIFKPDIAFVCTGIKPNSSYLKGFDSALNEKKQVKVNQYLQISGFSNIFAPGDINDMPVEKTAQNATEQAKIVAENIVRIEKGKVLKTYAPRKTPLCISLGKSTGILEVGGIVITGILPALIKWFVEKKEMFLLRH